MYHLYGNCDLRLLLIMNKVGYIYRITNIVNGKIYVGKTKGTVHARWLGHQRDYKRYIQNSKNSSKLYNAIKKHGIENFQIEEIDSCPYDQLDDRERYWIKLLDSRNPAIGYNICIGGECGPGGPRFAGHHHSAETKSLMSQSRRGRNNANYGHHRVMPEEEKPKHAHPGESNGMFGKRHSEKTRQLNRKQQVGRIWIHKDDIQKHIWPEDWPKYESQGFLRGMGPKRVK